MISFANKIETEEEKKRNLKAEKRKKKTHVFKFHGSTQEVDKRAFFIVPATFPLRKWVIWLASWQWFEWFIIALIILNSLSLAFFDYSDRDGNETRNKMLNIIGLFFTYAFTLECIIKIWSYGFIMHDTAYLRDGWNWLDFFVVIIGILQNVPGIPSLKGLRTLRVLRPLRSINAVPSMKRHT